MAVGDIKKVKKDGRTIILKQVKEEGFGKFKIISNVPSSSSRLSKVI